MNIAVCCAIGLYRWIIADRALRHHSSKAWGGGSEGEGVSAAGCRQPRAALQLPLHQPSAPGAERHHTNEQSNSPLWGARRPDPRGFLGPSNADIGSHSVSLEIHGLRASVFGIARI
jgi:hypothetical protein